MAKRGKQMPNITFLLRKKLFTKLITKTDTTLCRYLGLTEYKLTPNFVKKKSNKIYVYTSEPFRRHLLKEPLNNIQNNIEKITPQDKIILGEKIGNGILTIIKTAKIFNYNVIMQQLYYS
jgi:hypothetical protein